MKALTRTDFHFDGQKSVYHGKVRDVYNINDDIIVMIATDRISASTLFCLKEYLLRVRFLTRSHQNFWIKQRTFVQTGNLPLPIQWLQLV